MSEVATNAGLVIEGYASLWGVADLNRDVVAKGAFSAGLARVGAGGIRMLHQHEGRAVVGVWETVVEDDRGLFVRGRIMDWSAEARFAGALAKAGAIDGLSIGFKAKRARREGAFESVERGGFVGGFAGDLPDAAGCAVQSFALAEAADQLSTISRTRARTFGSLTVRPAKRAKNIASGKGNLRTKTPIRAITPIRTQRPTRSPV